MDIPSFSLEGKAAIITVNVQEVRIRETKG